MEKKWWSLLVIGVVFNIVLFLFDKPLIQFASFFRVYLLDYFFISIAFASNVFVIFFFLTSLFLWKEHKRRWILPLWLTSLSAVLISFVIKNIVRRIRPFEGGMITVLGLGQYFLKGGFSFSFPSFQAVLVFSALPILDKEFPKFKYVWLGFAILVALSRVYFGLNYFSDVLAGAILGLLIGYVFIKIEDKYKMEEESARS